MRPFLILFTVLGLGFLTWLITESGLHAVWAGIIAIGWGVVPVTLYHLVPVILDGWAWYRVLPASSGVGFRRLLLFRWIRESVNALLPVAEIGGEIVGARLLALSAVPAGIAGAGVVLDRSLQIVAQALYTVIGLALLAGLAGGAAYIPWAVLVSVLGFGLVGVFLLAQRWGLLRLLENGVRRLTADENAGLDGLHDHLMTLYRNHPVVGANFSWHLIAWLVNAGEVWLILLLMGVPTTFPEAVVLHSLGQAARSAAFFIPAGLGVQEGSYVTLGALFGIPPGIAVATSLVRRAREVILGLPGLLAWQAVEGRRIFNPPSR